ncbi:hypothetical protein ACR9YC_12625 [Parasphingorhabdus sp. DH2-15]|uniref:hypothetical protein n=1 Tax=Parasphingorhabdus sp. DH2-15 TaxID=3444112 RepID=UPI003F6838E5
MAILNALLLAAATACSPLQGWEDIATVSSDKILVFGETHGTSESPKAVEEYICALLERDETVLLAIEFSATTNNGFQTAWRKPHAQFREALFDNVASWSNRDDGVASEAMLNMLVRLHKFKSEGSDINIVAFNGTRNAEQTSKFQHLLAQGPHEAAQAENIYVASIARPYNRVIVLVGSLHAQKAQENWDGAIFDPMAARLAQYTPALTLIQANHAGEHWSCRLTPEALENHSLDHNNLTDDDIICGPNTSKANTYGQKSVTMGLWHADDDTAPKGFDGYFHIGAITASPPAKR